VVMLMRGIGWTGVMLPPADQVPDVFVYLYRGKKQERVCYARIPATKLLAQVRCGQLLHR